MTREAFHLDPEKERPVPGSNFFERFRGRIVDLLDALSFDLAPVVPLENVQNEGVRVPCRHADAIGVVLDEKEHGKFFFFCETNCFEKIPLACRSVTYRCDNEIFLPIKFNAPGDPAGREKL